MKGTFGTKEEHEDALSKAEQAGLVAIRIIRAPFPDWHALYIHLSMEGDAEGTEWHNDANLNEKLRVVGPAKNGLTCWFSMFLPKTVYDSIKFIDGVYDISRMCAEEDSALLGCIAVRDTIFMRRGVDHGALVEVLAHTTNHEKGYQAIEDSNPVGLWRLTQRLAAFAEQFYDVQAGTKIAIRTRYRPQKTRLIHTVMVVSKAHSRGLEWKVMQRLRQLQGQPADLLMDGRRFRLTDFESAESAHAPSNERRMRAQADSDIATQGRRCTIDNLPGGCDQARLEEMLSARGLVLTAAPVLIDSKFRAGTRVAFVIFADENMALHAIMEAPFMTMSGIHPTIKPTQPKQHRSLSSMEADERKRMDEVGPTDGMTKKQYADVVKLVDTSSGPQLDFLREQFKINVDGTFANELVNRFKIEMLALKTEFQGMRHDFEGSISNLNLNMSESNRVQTEFQTNMVDAVQTISREHQLALSNVCTSLQNINTTVTGQGSRHQQQLEELNTRLDNLDQALKDLTFGPGSRHPPAPDEEFDGPYDSDDDESEPGPLGSSPVKLQESPHQHSSEATAIPAHLLTQDPAFADMDLGDDLTPPLCLSLIAEWNLIAGPGQTLEPGPMSTDLCKNALLARERLKASADTALTHTGDATPTTVVQNSLDLGPPQVRLQPSVDPRIQRKYGSDIQALFERQAADQDCDRANAQGLKRQATSPTAKSPSPGATSKQLDEQPGTMSPPRNKQRPELTEAQAREYIFRLVQTYPDNPAFEQLAEGYNASLIPRGVRARDILESLTPQHSPISYDTTWTGTDNNITAGMTRGLGSRKQ
jgi:hypothetical protein